jgi:hypothetical protein
VWWKVWLLILLAACVTGAVPVMLSGNALGLWNARLPGTLVLPTATATPVPDLALPRQAWVAVSTTVSPQPGRGSPIAELEPGFPVTMTAHAAAGGASWSHIAWAGPVKAAGGSGWVPDGALVSFGSGGRPIGDLGALSPSLAQEMSAYNGAFMVALYFPDTGQLYHVRADQSFALGDGFRAVLLAALYARAEAQHTGSPSSSLTPSSAQGAQIANGDGLSLGTAFAAVGGTQGVSTYLAGIGVNGLQPGTSDWSGAQATPGGLLAFYDALAQGSALNAADTATVETTLANGGTLRAANVLGGQSAGTGGVLVIGSAQASGGSTLSAGGLVVPAAGPRYIVAAVMYNQPTKDDAQKALGRFFAGLSALLAAR